MVGVLRIMYEGSMYLMSASLKWLFSSVRIHRPTSFRMGLPLRSVSWVPAARMSCTAQSIQCGCLAAQPFCPVVLMRRHYLMHRVGLSLCPSVAMNTAEFQQAHQHDLMLRQSRCT